MNTGLDPELLTLDKGLIVPAEFFLDSKAENEHLSYDNAAMEIRPNQSDNLKELVGNTFGLLHMAEVKMRLARRRHQIPPGSKLSYIPAAMLPSKVRNLSSVRTFGCTPSQVVLSDFSTHTQKVSCPNVPFRSAGFHIHQELVRTGTVQAAVAVLDGLLGLTDVLMNHKAGWTYASRVRRKELRYGRAGEYRLRKVNSGRDVLEYRVMSPWPLSHRKYVGWAASVMKSVCECPLDVLVDVLDHFPSRKLITKMINHDINDYPWVSTLSKTCGESWKARR